MPDDGRGRSPPHRAQTARRGPRGGRESDGSSCPLPPPRCLPATSMRHPSRGTNRLRCFPQPERGDGKQRAESLPPRSGCAVHSAWRTRPSSGTPARRRKAGGRVSRDAKRSRHADPRSPESASRRGGPAGLSRVRIAAGCRPTHGDRGRRPPRRAAGTARGALSGVPSRFAKRDTRPTGRGHGAVSVSTRQTNLQTAASVSRRSHRRSRR
jgi:hypothetical protein